jgi:alkanesulfonate monooxygenase SsuD/methylene tetrahydromethanopterin reductase-like flavin-dependent oxidoreductase (luciferase family)
MPRRGWICDASSPDALAQTRAAEDAGLDVVVVMHDAGGDLWDLLGSIAGATRELHLLPVTSAPVVSDPLAAAGEIARLVEQAPGRIELGLQVGDPARDGHPLLNWERMSRMRHVLPALHGLLAGREVAIETPHLTLHGRLERPPAAPLPIRMLADGPSSAVMAATLADGAIVEATHVAREEVIGPFRAAAPGAPVAVLARAASVDDAVEAAAELEPDLIAVRVEGDPIAAMRELAR